MNIVTERNEVYDNVASEKILGVFEEEEDAYWEPADTVSKLYGQLYSKKYREIVQNEIK